MKKYTIYLIAALVLVFGLSTGLALAASMSDYCVLPPYVKRNVRPNIMIILDNSTVNGAPAYTATTDDESITDGLTGFLAYNATTVEPYAGLHNPALWYYDNGNRFDPADPAGADPNKDKAVFEGNLLNWLTTSRYDLIQSVLVGGKSASRQANAHTLVGYNASDPYDSDPADPAWDKRIYVYEGEDSNMYACEFIVNDADKGDLTITDSGAYFSTFGYTCGLILATPVRPAAGYRRIASADTPADTLLAALSPAPDTFAAGGEPGPFMRGLYRFMNRVFSIGASPAYAGKPLRLDSKTFSGVPDATRFQSYSGHQFFATGGVGSYSWSMSGAPAGMSIDAGTGFLSGWPTDVPGQTYTLTITVTDQDTPVAASDSANVDIFLYGSVVSLVSPTDGGTLTDAVRFEPYSYQAIASGGDGSYTWSIIAGSLPPGITLNNATGLISGTTTDWPGTTYNLTLQVDDGYDTATAAVSITVQGQWFQIGAPMGDLPEGKQNEPYVGYTCEASGGSGSYTWSVDPAWPLPPGLSIDSATGYISGTPTVAGSFQVHIIVDDGVETRDAWPFLYVSGGLITWPNDGFNMGDTIWGMPYTNRFQPVAQGGTGVYTWGAIGLPAGLVINSTTGIINGTTKDTLFSWIEFTITVDDGVTGDSVRASTYIYNTAAIDIVWPWDGGTLPSAVEGQPYQGASPATFYGDGQNTFAALGLPPGLSMAPDSGLITGTPITAGSYPVTITVTQQDMVTTDTVNVTLDVVPAGAPVVYKPEDGFWLPDGYEGISYSYTCEATGGTGVFTWSAVGLPAGLSIDPATGIISGLPGAGTSGSYMVSITVDDGTWTDTATVNIWINSSGVVSITAPPNLGSLPMAYEGDPYGGYSPAATGGTGRYTWSASGLPAGLSMDPATGFISGVAGVGTGGDPAPIYYTVTITVDDGLNTDSVTADLGVLDIAGLNVATFNVRVCASESGTNGYTVNCNNPPVTGGLKHGLLQDFWDQAWYGLIDFDNAGDPAYNCLPQDNDESFYTAVENATPVDVITKLIDAEYVATRTYDPDKVPKLSSCTDPFDPGDHASVPEYLNGMKCRQNFILMLTAGEGATTGSLVFDGTDSPPLASPCDALPTDIEKNACYANENDLRSTVDGKQNVSTYIVNMMGTNEDILEDAAEDAGGGEYYGVESPSLIADSIKTALQDIIKRAASGTAASVLASGEGSGANLIQAVYYPVKRFDDSASNDYDEARWIGRLSNFWFYVDPFFQNNSIRENTVQEVPPTLDLIDDQIVELYFNPTLERVQADLFTDTDGDGDADDINGDSVVTSIGDPGTGADDAYTKDFEVVQSLWEAGVKLWERDLGSDPRTIYANIENTTVLAPFDLSLIANTTVQDLMNIEDWNSDSSKDDDTSVVINYLHGVDFTNTPSIRDRTVRFVDLNKDGDTEDAGEDTPRVWKLGDVINSTPNVSSWIPLNIYHKPPYSDDTYQEYVDSATYVNRGMVFAGANDGMLHAFKLGKLELNWVGQGAHEKSRLTGSNLGREEWAFIPHNALPYLRYQLEPGYCHVYTVDLSPYIFDASFAVDPDVNDDAVPDQPAECNLAGDPGTLSNSYANCKKSVESWRTVLIGGMRYGGACRDETVTCDSSNTVDTNLDGSIDDLDCVKTPVSDVGYSSYFALDVTDQNNPELLWEFSHPDLGYATTGPAIVRICGQANTDGFPGVDGPDCQRNGKWIAVIGSGPTGPIKPGSSQFLANSDQNLRLFLIDVGTGQLLRTIDTGVPYAFASSMLNVTNDSDMDYQDEALYVGFVKDDDPADNMAGTWIQGGVGRLLTGENTDVSTWNWSLVIDDVGPVASAPTRLQNNLSKELWLFFGTGRYFYEDAGGADDAAGTRHLAGITEPCYDGMNMSNPLDPSCSTTVNYADLTDVTAIAAGTNDPDGWYIELDAQEPVTGSFEAERVITDPLSSSSGIVFYTTFKPYKDVCSIGGKSHIWAVHYASGGGPGSLLKGTALIQVSTGSIEKIDLGSAFNEKGGRRTSAIEGVPPIAQGFSIFKTPPPVERIIHMHEK